jgi:hypothetical protein
VCHQNEEEGSTWLGDSLIGCLIKSPELCCFIHDLAPLHCVRDNKEACHCLNGVIKVHELVVPYPSEIQAFPLSLRSPSNACLSTVKQLASEIVDGDNAKDKVEKERDYHDCDIPEIAMPRALILTFKLSFLEMARSGLSTLSNLNNLIEFRFLVCTKYDIKVMVTTMKSKMFHEFRM